MLEGELDWLTFQEIAIKARSLGWQAKPQSIKMALDLEEQKPSRRVRSSRVQHIGQIRIELVE